MQHSLRFLGLSTVLLGLACAGLEDNVDIPSLEDLTTESPSSEVSAFSLKVGDCFQDVDGTSVSELTVVSCDEPHDNEVFHAFDVTLSMFDESKVEDAARSGCTNAFEPYVGRDYDSSKYYASWLTPTAGSWDERNDREVICILYEDGNQMVGSARNTGL